MRGGILHTTFVLSTYNRPLASLTRRTFHSSRARTGETSHSPCPLRIHSSLERGPWSPPGFWVSTIPCPCSLGERFRECLQFTVPGHRKSWDGLETRTVWEFQAPMSW